MLVKMKIVEFVLLINAAICTAAYVDLNVTSIDGSSLHQAGVGQPFLITVTIDSPTNSEPSIEGLERFQLMGKSKRMSTINGRTTISYSYQVFGNAVGNFTIGPASIEVSGSTKQSNNRVIRVAQQEKSERPQQTEEKELAKLQLSVDKSHVVVGEKIRCTLQFAGISDKVQLEQIANPHFDAIIDEQSGPVTHNEQRNGKLYTIAEWTFDIRPNKPGKLVLPACSADVAIQKEVNDHLSAFSIFFKYRNELRKIYSNAATIEVTELPVSKNAIQTIGTFDYLHASLKPAVAKEGEGMVLTLALKGDVPLNAVETPQLQNMPPALKWYESKHYLQEPEGAKEHKTLNFEYVVQGLQQGTWEIPAQQFTYFDVKCRSVKTLRSSPITVAIEPNGILSTASHSSHAEAKSNDKEPQEELSSIITEGNWQATKPAIIPWPLFFILALAPLLWALWRALQLYALHYAPYFKQRNAFNYARKQIIKTSQTGASDQLRAIFFQAIAVRLNMSPSLLSQEIIERKLSDVGMDSKKINAFDSFLTMLHEFSFYKRQAQGNESLFDQANRWLDELERVL